MENEKNKYTLSELLGKYDICIPIIQRDYVHGRTDSQTENVRKNLLADMIACLQDKQKRMDFNFVYGTVSEDENTFYTVDGQQRLTTLYLISWYLAVRSGAEALKGRFSYMTRNSAEEFFTQLSQVKTGDTVHQMICDPKNSSIKAKLENSTWFRQNWFHDPTVQSAIVVLDCLHKNLINKDVASLTEMYDNLNNIYFQLEIEEGTAGNPDQKDEAERNAAKSYLRMNARGKPLEQFENLKAMLDHIDGRLSTPYQLTERYDGLYTDTLFNELNGLPLNVMTNQINKRSINLFRNVFNFCVLAFKHKPKTVSTNTELLAEVHHDSREETPNEEFYSKYIQMLVHVLNLYCLRSHQADCLQSDFDRLFTNSIHPDNLENFAYLLCSAYDHPLVENSGKADELTRKCSLLNYVIKNFTALTWKKGKIKTIRCMAEASGEKDIFELFLEKTLDELYTLIGISNEKDQAIIKEQKIKAEIVRTNSLKDNYFEPLESKDSERCVRYLLYLSGYWDGNPDITILKKYYIISGNYYHNHILEWQKLWAVVQYYDNNQIRNSQDIDAQCGNYIPWNEDFYFWDSPDVPDEKQAKLDMIKKAYDHLPALKNELNENSTLLTGGHCWLKYAVKYANKDKYAKLLKYPLSNENGTVHHTGDNKPFDMVLLYVIHGENSGHIRYGLNELSVPEKKIFTYKGGTSLNPNYNAVNIYLTLKKQLVLNALSILSDTDCLSELVSSSEKVNYTVYHRTGNYTYQKYEFDLTIEWRNMISAHYTFDQINEHDANTQQKVWDQRSNKSISLLPSCTLSFEREKNSRCYYMAKETINVNSTLNGTTISF